MFSLDFFWRKLPKPVCFGLLAAVGCCLAVLLLGEPLLAAMPLPQPPPPPQHDIVLLIDTSGSMETDGKIDEVKAAATAFIRRRDWATDRVAIVGFDDRATLISALSDQPEGLEKAVSALTAETGYTRMDLGLMAAKEQLQQATGEPSVLLFTDGQPVAPDDFADDAAAQAATLAQASQAKTLPQMQIVAIATQNADSEFLTQVTGDRTLVFPAETGNFESAFQSAEAAIYRTEIIGGEPIAMAPETGRWLLMLRVGSFATIVALGIGFALIIGQNLYCRRQLLTLKDSMLIALGGLAVGFSSGIIGQGVYSLNDSQAQTSISPPALLFSWTVLGALMGLGMAFFIPNLSWGRALLGGGIGGTLGATGFLLITRVLPGDMVARLLGFTLLGFFIGLMIAIAENFNDAWLVVHWGPKEFRKVGLGSQPIVLGSSSRAHIYLPRNQGFIPITATVSVEENRVRFDDNLNNQQHFLRNGSRIQVGGIDIEVKMA